ncbi:sporulation histidine kinase inhibitor Sda [Paenibacillus sp. FJAT-27812]|uniref:sporulation histidine kinase inhibitor Sda n=1 Tax=Paenibacillus sp. FJAT-27812 TaxID=1684143 RepID=UPI0009E78DCD|nr:sporulation histidine kinase inhibitor Sda [Paenibacillus sp. FJAT-27812]
MNDKRDSMQEVSSELLCETYWTALQLGLDQGFVEMLKAELARRGIDINNESE